MRTLPLVVSLALEATLCFGQELDLDLIWHSHSPSQSEAAALLQAVCPGDAQPSSSASGSVPSCETCPEYTSMGAEGLKRGVSVGSLDLQTVTYGSFTAPGVEEAVASFLGCVPHAGGWGGSILFRKRHGSWVMLGYAGGLITSGYRVYPLKTGRDLLLCGEQDFGQGTMRQWIFVCDFSREATLEARSHTVFTALDDRSGIACRPWWVSIDEAALRDLNGDGMPDLTVRVSVGRRPSPNPGESAKVGTSSAPAERQKLDFLFQQDANSFVVAPGSKALMERLQAIMNTPCD
jgi:hypothetical protein